MNVSAIFREGIIINDDRSETVRVSEIYHLNKIYKITSDSGEVVEAIVVNDCCVDRDNIENLMDKINALKVYENNLKIANCKKYIAEHKNHPFASRMTYTKKELASYRKENRELQPKKEPKKPAILFQFEGKNVIKEFIRRGGEYKTLYFEDGTNSTYRIEGV